MPTFATPWVLAVGALASAGIVTLHFLSVQRPPELLLPTARFLDEGSTRAVSRSAKPSDVLLLLVRVAALLLACVALAGPRWSSGRAETLRLVVADVAWRRDSTTLAQALDSLDMSAAQLGNDGGPATSAAARGARRFVWMDSADRVGALAGLRISLASALPLAVRVASASVLGNPSVDSLRLRIVTASTQAVDEASWRVWRSAWPGAVQVMLIRVPGRAGRAVDSATTIWPRVEYDGAGADDPVRAALAIRTPAGTATSRGAAGLPRVARRVRVLRMSGDGADAASLEKDSSTVSALAKASRVDSASAVVTVRWPKSGQPAGWTAVPDTIGAIAARGVALVGVWPRSARASATALRGAQAVAWWADGQVAALERETADGCSRDVGVVVPSSGELLLDPAADALLEALVAPCHAAIAASAPLPALVRDNSLDRWKGAAAPATAFRSESARDSGALPFWLTPLLLALALALLLFEWMWRATSTRAGLTGAGT